MPTGFWQKPKIQKNAQKDQYRQTKHARQCSRVLSQFRTRVLGMWKKSSSFLPMMEKVDVDSGLSEEKCPQHTHARWSCAEKQALAEFVIIHKQRSSEKLIYAPRRKKKIKWVCCYLLK